MPAYNRMDIGVNFHKQKKHGIRTWNISVYNAYNRQNPFVVMWDTKRVVTDGQTDSGTYQTVKTKTILTQYSLFPIIPSVSYSYKF